MNFEKKNVLITGGMGFIGSNLAIRLAEEGAKVFSLDNFLEGHGGNEFNISPAKRSVKAITADVRDVEALSNHVKNKDYIFHLAGNVSHVKGLSDPFQDIDINIGGTTVLLEACKKYNPNTRIIFAGTRGQYGACAELPVREDHPMNPKGMYELTKMCAEKLFRIYEQNFGIRSITLRLSNIYGPRAQMKNSDSGVANWFVRLALDGGTIKLFDGGKIKRDFLFIDDTTSAMLKLAARDEAYGEEYNLGNDKPSSFSELAEIIIRTAGKGAIEITPFPKERKLVEPGDYYPDITKISKRIGWKPKISLEEGIEKTVKYYADNKKYYW